MSLFLDCGLVALFSMNSPGDPVLEENDRCKLPEVSRKTEAKCAWLFFSWQVVRPGFDLATAISCGDVEGAGRLGCADSMCPKHIVWEAFEVQGLG